MSPDAVPDGSRPLPRCLAVEHTGRTVSASLPHCSGRFGRGTSLSTFAATADMILRFTHHSLAGGSILPWRNPLRLQSFVSAGRQTCNTASPTGRARRPEVIGRGYALAPLSGFVDVVDDRRSRSEISSIVSSSVWVLRSQSSRFQTAR